MAYAEMQGFCHHFFEPGCIVSCGFDTCGKGDCSEPTATKLVACKLTIAFWESCTGVAERSIKQLVFFSYLSEANIILMNSKGETVLKTKPVQ